MRKIFLTLLVAIALMSCEKGTETVVNEYSLEMKAEHTYSIDDIEYDFEEGYAYYSIKLTRNGDVLNEYSGMLTEDTANETFEAKTGDDLYLYLTVNNVYDLGTLSVKSKDGSIVYYETTDNLYLPSSGTNKLKSAQILEEVHYKIK